MAFVYIKLLKFANRIPSISSASHWHLKMSAWSEREVVLSVCDVVKIKTIVEYCVLCVLCDMREYNGITWIPTHHAICSIAKNYFAMNHKFQSIFIHPHNVRQDHCDTLLHFTCLRLRWCKVPLKIVYGSRKWFQVRIQKIVCMSFSSFRR